MNFPRILTATIVGAALALPAGAQAQSAPTGATIYKRCAACHTATGAGVPGAFPPLKQDTKVLAARKDGRRYLALAVIRGLSGPITVEGKTYRGVMPAQSLDDASVAAVLNYVLAELSPGPAPRAFTAKEIAAIRKGGATLSPADIAKLHGSVGGK